MEALIGAVYLDGGIIKIKELVLHWIDDFWGGLAKNMSHHNPKGQLQEWVQENRPGAMIKYTIVKESGPDHAKHFESEISINYKTYGKGAGKSKKDAETSCPRGHRFINWHHSQRKEVLRSEAYFPASSAKAVFYPSLPESAHGCLVANTWLESGNQCLLLITESIIKAESWGEDVAGIAEQLSPGLAVRFHLFDEAPDSTHPDAFDRICERTSVLSFLGQFTQSGKSREKLIVLPHPKRCVPLAPYLSILIRN